MEKDNSMWDAEHVHPDVAATNHDESVISPDDEEWFNLPGPIKDLFGESEYGDEDSCETCLFFSEDEHECRRRSPQLAIGEPFRWPQVTPDEWCGEWEEK